MSKLKTITLLVSTFFLLALIGFLNYLAPNFSSVSYSAPNSLAGLNQAASSSSSLTAPASNVYHIQTPASVKAIYMTSYVAGTPSLRAPLITLLETKEINAVVIDVKDYTGKISFTVNDSALKAYGADENRISDIDSLIALLHAHGIYVIGRIASFQDPFMATKQPSWAVKNAATGATWADKKGISWIDAGAKPDWQYLSDIATEAYARGFDEVNYDYIRFPTDGDLSDMTFPYSGTTTKHEIIRSFFSYLHDTLGPQHIPFSVDIFGLTTSATGDMGIGQEIGDALQYADFVSPMVYPSAFASGYDGFSDPSAHPYDVIKSSMGTAVMRANAMVRAVASAASSTTSSTGTSTLSVYATKLRPWLQDFSLGTTYTPDMVREQMQATYDVGLSSWLLWNAANHYSDSALLPKQ